MESQHKKEICIGFLFLLGVMVVAIGFVTFHAYDPDVIKADTESRIKLHQEFDHEGN